MSDIDISVLRQDNNLKPMFYHDKCDKYDYLIAVASGAIAGMVDIFLVGSPGDSKLQTWTDAQVDKTVMGFAKACGWSPKEGKEKSVASAIGFLEKRFPVNYDHRNTTDVGGLFDMGTKNHHMKSLAHSPDIIGLFFSILNQFTSTASFLSGGQLITIKTHTYELQGHNFISKLFCGVTNWFGHIMSDVAGSSGSVNRGSGVVIPFFELFQLCEFGSFQVGKNRNTLATVATKVFQEGYDARFGLTMGIPVVLCDLLIKLIWAIKHYFYHKRPFAECIPTKKHDDLRIMLILGDGTLCLMDGADAAIRSGGNWVNFFLRLNIVAWYRLVLLVFREVCIRLGISFPLQKQLDAYIRINEALTLYLAQLEQIDIERFKEETTQYNKMVVMLEGTETEEELNILLRNEYKAIGFSLPYNGDFDDFMKDNSSVLEFK
ncbi:hypothetical protein AAGC94_18430 [Clostridium sporogenes]|uniref:hypothetical protein n=1 Tax=Clostridium sporogenes TaxID=1509 RepID=UPI00313D9E9F